MTESRRSLVREPAGAARATETPTGKAIWIDTDIVFNRFPEDVDDGLALMMALDSPAVRIRGISLNRRVDNGARVTRRLLGHHARYEIPVYKGTDNIFASYGHCTEAVDRLAEALQRERLTIVAIGAATNLANLLTFYPEQAGNIDEIVFCAGRSAGTRFNAGSSRVGLPDANFDNDPRSFLRVLDAGIPITLSGFEAASSVWLDRRDILRIARNGRPGDRWVARRLRMWHVAWRLGLRLDGFIPFDACTIGHVLYPECFDYHRDIPVQINLRDNDARRWRKDPQKQYLEASYAFESPYRVDFAYAASPRYKDKLMYHLLGQASS